MGYIFGLFLIITNLVNKHKRKIIFLLLACIFVFSIFSLNVTNPDYRNYVYSYLNLNSFDDLNISLYSSPLFYGLMIVFKKLNVEYSIFVLFISILGIGILLRSVFKMNGSLSVFIGLYLIYPFALDVVQLKFFLATAFLIYSLTFLKENKTFKFLLFYLLSLASHFSLIVFLPFFILQKINFNKYKLLVLIGIIIGVLVFMIGDIPGLTFLVEKLFGADKLIEWSVVKTNYGFLISWFLTFFIIGVLRLIIYYSSEKTNNNLIFYYKFVYYTMLLLPIFTLESTYGRFFQPTVLIVYSIVGNIGNVKSKNKNLILFLGIIISIVLFTFRILLPHYNEVFRSIFETF